MKTLQQYPRPDTLIPWVKWHLRNQRDVMIEYRGPKGFGKSAMMFHHIQKLQYGYPFKQSLCYNHKQYVNVAKRLRRIRKAEDARNAPRSLQVLWMDDATRIANRRDHMTKKNKRFLDFMRTSRDAIESVQLVGTQDDFVERPMMEIGPYLLILFKQPYTGWICWPKRDEMMKEEPRWVPMFPMRAPRPEDAYASLWPEYKQERRRLTDQLQTDALKALDDRQQLPDTEDMARLRAEGMPYEAIGKRFGISQQAASQRLQRRERHLST